MYCIKCGKEIIEESSYCPNWGNQLVSEQILSDDRKDKANLLCILSLVVTFASSIPLGILIFLFPILKPVLSSLYGICPMAGIVLMIIARIKYPESKFAKVLMWMYIFIIILVIIGAILLVIACSTACRNISIDFSRCDY